MTGKRLGQRLCSQHSVGSLGQFLSSGRPAHWAIALGSLVSLWSLVARTETPAASAPRLQRRLLVSSPGPQSLPIDLELLGGAKPTLADLRLFDATNQEVPYLLIPPSKGEPIWRDARNILTSRGDRSASGFEADLGSVLRFDRVRILGLASPFMKRLRLEASGDRRHYATLASDATLFDLPAEGLQRREIDVVPSAFRYLRVTWDDRGTSPVALPTAVSVRLSAGGGNAVPLRASIPFELRPTGPELSQWRIRLPAKGLPVTALELDSVQPQLLRQARVSESRLENGRLESRMLGSAVIRKALRSGLVAETSRIPVQPPEGNELVITVDNGNNPPLSLRRVTLELLPQPSLYFEAATLGAYFMRYGNKLATPPKYDLEAERDHLPLSRLGAATWTGPAEPLAGSEPAQRSSISNESLRHGSPVNTAGFKYSRRIRETGGGAMTVLRLDAAVLAHSRELSDLRILDAQSHQVPYLVERESEPLVVALTATAVTDEGRPNPPDPRQTYYRIELPEAQLPDARLLLTTQARVFQRQVSLLTIPDGQTADRAERRAERRQAPRVVTIASWVHADPHQAAPPIALAVPAGTDQKLILAIEDGDNVPLVIESVRLHLPATSLRFFQTEGESLTLHYGDPALPAPSYDLALLSEEMGQLPFVEASLEPEQARALPPAKRDPATRWFWGILVITVLGLLALIARLVRKSTPNATPNPEETSSTDNDG